MVSRAGPAEGSLVINFGGGLHTRPGADDIEATEAFDGNNFLIDYQNKQLKNRRPFDLVGTAPNAGAIKGGISLRKADGSVTTLIQAGTKVYVWNGSTGWTDTGVTVSASAQLRGHWQRHYWALADLVLITDLTKNERILSWDGTTLAYPTFTDETGASFGNFYAQYCLISNERAIFANEKDATTNPHLIIGSKVSNYLQLTVRNAPSTAIGNADPFFLLSPDLKPINGLVEAFGTIVVSTENGQLFGLSGASAQDFAFLPFYPGSGASGTESLTYIGNDVLYGKRGRIESVNDTNRFGDSEYDNIASNVTNVIDGYSAWTLIYNSRINRAYAFPSGGSEVWVCDTAMLPTANVLAGGKNKGVSPWMRWRTRHSLGFQPTFVMSMLDPVDGLEYVFMGDSTGNLYRLEGTGAAGDGGTEQVQMEWLSKTFQIPDDAQGYAIEGFVSYAKNEAFTITLIFEYQGEALFSETIQVTAPATSGRLYFGGANYFGGTAYFGSRAGQYNRQPILVPGQANAFQLRIQVSAVSDWIINEVGLRFNAVGK